MPQLNTSNVVKQRVGHLLKQLLAYANDELPEYEHLRSKLIVRWLDEKDAAPKLIVNTELRFLAELTSSPQSEQTTTTVKHDLHVLKRFLDILEDNRTKTQGSAKWHFTLKLWHRSPEINLREFQQAWDIRKSAKSHSSTAQVSETLPHPETPSAPTEHISSVPAVLYAPSITPPAGVPSAFAQRMAPFEGDRIYPRHNLPASDYSQFLGRQSLITRLQQLLHPDHPASRISVEGIGGIGKTGLVLEMAQRCLQESTNTPCTVHSVFDAIVFTSAKQHYLTTRGILPRLRQERTLHHIIRAIAHTLGYSHSFAEPFDETLEQIQALLSRQRVLLIVDNLETLETQRDVLAFLYDLPATVKVVITSCERAVMDVSIRLEPLPEDEGIQLIEHQANIKNVQLSQEDAQRLYQATGGIPAAIVYAVGQLANGYLLADVLPRLTLAESDFCRFYFEQSLKPLRGQSAHLLLMALALFPQPASREAIAQVALADTDTDAADGLARLHQLSLITLQDGRYTMLPLTRDYALAELQSNPDFEHTARQRWVNWLLAFVEQHGNPNWREWQDYFELEQEWETVQAAIEWCIEHQDHTAFTQFWQYVKGYTHLHGYWHERLSWMDWWHQAALQRGDLANVAQALRDRAWTLTLMGKPDQLSEAESLFQQVWELRNHTDSTFQFELAIEQLILAMHQQHLDAAHRWLAQANRLLEQVPLDSSEQQRQRIRIGYYTAEVWYRDGDYDQAKRVYQQVLQQAQVAQWQQVEIYCANWLADIALNQSNLDEAEKWLDYGLPIAQAQQDKRSISFHLRSWAQLHQLRGNLIQFQQCAIEAKRCFEELAMDTEATEMQTWLDTES